VAVALAVLPDPIHSLRSVVGWLFIPAYVLYLFLVLRPQERTRSTSKRSRRRARRSRA